MIRTSTFSLLLIANGLAAQPVLEYADFGAVQLNWYTLDDPGNITIPSNGSGQVWDWTSATWELAGTAAIAPAAGTPYALDYPAANWVFYLTPTGGSSVYSYLFVDASGIQTIAGNVPGGGEVYTDYRRVLQVPLSYGGTFTDTYAGSDDGTDMWAYSGAGTLRTALGDFADLAKLMEAQGDINIWNSDPVFPRVIASDGEGPNLFTSGTTAIGEVDAFPAMALSPVPVSSTLRVRGVEQATDWSVLDVMGRIVRSGRMNGAPVLEIDLSALASGSYTLRMANAQGARAQTFAHE